MNETLKETLRELVSRWIPAYDYPDSTLLVAVGVIQGRHHTVLMFENGTWGTPSLSEFHQPTTQLEHLPRSFVRSLEIVGLLTEKEQYRILEWQDEVRADEHIQGEVQPYIVTLLSLGYQVIPPSTEKQE